MPSLGTTFMRLQFFTFVLAHNLCSDRLRKACHVYPDLASKRIFRAVYGKHIHFPKTSNWGHRPEAVGPLTTTWWPHVGL